MNRVLPALAIAALITAAIMLTLNLVIGGDWASENHGAEGIATDGNSNSGPILVNSISLEQCKDVIGRYEKLIDTSRACQSDSDCQLVGLGCPFGCSTAIRAEELPMLVAERRKIKRCVNCVYNCTSPPLGWKAKCIANQCERVENSVVELERATRESVIR